MLVTKRSLFIIAVSFLLSLLYALPNLYPDVPVLIIHHPNLSHQELAKQTLQWCNTSACMHTLNGKEDSSILKLQSTTSQMEAKAALESIYADKVSIDLNLLPNTPDFFHWLSAKPMKLGLDLRGGVHLLLEVDTSKHLSSHKSESLALLEELKYQSIRYQNARLVEGGTVLTFKTEQDKQIAATHLAVKHSNHIQSNADNLSLHVKYADSTLHRHTQYLMTRTLESIQNRVNELGLSEAIVTQQGDKHISVDLPGIQDIGKAKQLLGNTSSLSFHLVQVDPSNTTKETTTVTSASGSSLPIETESLLTGDAITYAATGNQDGKPIIQVQLDPASSKRFYAATSANIGKPMAIVLSESHKQHAGKARSVHQRVISAPTIQDGLKHSFMISGVGNNEEAETLALLLRSGSLAAPVDIVSQATVGPSLGAENIQKGLVSIGIGLGSIMLFMVVYYKRMGLIANTALVLNLTLMITLMSWLEATLTLPAMAAIVLSVGMAVDANVLINERIREELRAGSNDAQAALMGYEKAFSSIFDANVTTLIVAVILYVFSGGMIKGFAITLIVGLLTSLYTSVYVTRTLTFTCMPYIGQLSKAIGV